MVVFDFIGLICIQGNPGILIMILTMYILVSYKQKLHSDFNPVNWQPDFQYITGYYNDSDNKRIQGCSAWHGIELWQEIESEAVKVFENFSSRK